LKTIAKASFSQLTTVEDIAWDLKGEFCLTSANFSIHSGSSTFMIDLKCPISHDRSNSEDRVYYGITPIGCATPDTWTRFLTGEITAEAGNWFASAICKSSLRFSIRRPICGAKVRNVRAWGVNLIDPLSASSIFDVYMTQVYNLYFYVVYLMHVAWTRDGCTDLSSWSFRPYRLVEADHQSNDRGQSAVRIRHTVCTVICKDVSIEKICPSMKYFS
jgi:hypothetical protein